MAEAYKPISYFECASGRWQASSGAAVVEAPVSLTVNGENWLSFMCTPIDLEALAVGFLFNEGLIQSQREIADVRVCSAGDNVDVWLRHAVEKPERWARTSGCTGGVTGVRKPSGKTTPTELPLLTNGSVFTPAQITGLVSQLFEVQEIYRKTGGIHTTALSDGERLILAVEDIGRHNTLDKIAGRWLLQGYELPHKVLITTGRISSEMLQKAVRLGASLLISRTAASSLAIELAEKSGITLIGYARRDRFTVYANPQRILFPDSTAQPDPSSEEFPSPKPEDL